MTTCKDCPAWIMRTDGPYCTELDLEMSPMDERDDVKYCTLYKRASSLAVLDHREVRA